jgi:hypothetical protein
MLRGTSNRYPVFCVWDGISFHCDRNYKSSIEEPRNTVSDAAWESLHKAALELAKPAALKQRLTDAFTRHLVGLPTKDMPAEVRRDFEALRESMTRVRPQNGECPVAATVRKMSVGEADACAARIVALLDALHRTTAVVPQPANIRALVRAAGDTGSSRIPTLISVNRA